MFGNKIIKTISIKGMHCGHCSKRVEEALKNIKYVKSVNISLENKNAVVILKADVDGEVLKNAVEDIGFEVVEVR